MNNKPDTDTHTQIRNQSRVMAALVIGFFTMMMIISEPTHAQSNPGEPCTVCLPVKPNPTRPPDNSIPKPKPKPGAVVCQSIRIPGLSRFELQWCPGVGLVRGNRRP